MDITKARNRCRRKLNADNYEVKQIAENLLHINEDQFQLQSVESDRIKGLINKIVGREVAKAGHNSKIACLIRFCRDQKLPKLASDELQLRQSNIQVIKRRRALSPNPMLTYIGFSDYDPNNFSQTPLENYQLKKIKVVIKAKCQQTQSDFIDRNSEEEVKAKEEIDKKNMLSQMMK